MGKWPVSKERNTVEKLIHVKYFDTGECVAPIGCAAANHELRLTLVEQHVSEETCQGVFQWRYLSVSRFITAKV